MYKVQFQKCIKFLAPALYCIVLSSLKLNTIESTGDVVFFIFLPLCFIVVGSHQYEQLKRIEALELALKNKSNKDDNLIKNSDKTPTED